MKIYIYILILLVTPIFNCTYFCKCKSNFNPNAIVDSCGIAFFPNRDPLNINTTECFKFDKIENGDSAFRVQFMENFKLNLKNVLNMPNNRGFDQIIDEVQKGYSIAEKSSLDSLCKLLQLHKVKYLLAIYDLKYSCQWDSTIKQIDTVKIKNRNGFDPDFWEQYDSGYDYKVNFSFELKYAIVNSVKGKIELKDNYKYSGEKMYSSETLANILFFKIFRNY